MLEGGVEYTPALYLGAVCHVVCVSTVHPSMIAEGESQDMRASPAPRPRLYLQYISNFEFRNIILQTGSAQQFVRQTMA